MNSQANNGAYSAGKRRLSIAIKVYCLRGGGAERVCSYLANAMVEAGHVVTLITELDPSTDQYPIDPRIGRVVVGTPGARIEDHYKNSGSKFGKIWRMGRKILRLRRALQETRPDALVSFMTRSNNMAVVATRGLPVKTVICERNDPRLNPESGIDPHLRPHLYPRADLVVTQTDTIAEVMRSTFGLSHIVTIPNPCVPPQQRADAVPYDLPRPYMLAIGRLTPQKGFDVLIRAYARSIARQSLDLVIAGQGGHKSWFEEIAREEGVEDNIHFLGHVESPFELLRDCRMFVLSSHFEGFPNVLLEAMAAGRPVISTILPSGAHAMIEDGTNGVLVPAGDVEALSLAIDRLANNPAAAEEMGIHAPAAVECYRLPIVMAQWETVLMQLTMDKTT